MAEDPLTRHRHFLSEVRQRRVELAEEEKRLAIVEQFHLDAVSRLSKPARPRPATVNDHLPATEASPLHDVTPVDFSGVTRRYDACAMALRQLGGHQKTPAIARWLLAKGYVTGMEERVFYNAVYTAMNRKKDMFKKLRGGKWELIEKTPLPAGQATGS
ncbi:MAG: hypothetical protein ABSF26_19215 [Thermoguttaceae bacterium]